MHNLYGKRKLLESEIRGAFMLSNGMFCVWGEPDDEGTSVDIYEDKTKKLLVGMEHGIVSAGAPSEEALHMLMEGLIKEFENSMVYYYGPKESTFEKEDFEKNKTPKKTGKFAKE